MKEKYISIKEFSERANVSVQSIYKRLSGLNNPLNQYVKQIESQKMLDIQALKDIYGLEVEQPFKPIDSTDSTLESIRLLEKTIDILEKELEEKKKHNEELQKEVNRLNGEIINLSNKVGDTLQMITQTQLADKMIQGQKLIEEPVNKKWWQVWK